MTKIFLVEKNGEIINGYSNKENTQIIVLSENNPLIQTKSLQTFLESVLGACHKAEITTQNF